MHKQDIVYITGHQNPDTDSIASAIAYAYLKNKMGMHAVACRLGNLNKETEYLLTRFGFETPMLLKDARITLADLVIDEPYAITPYTTVREAIQLMEKYNRPSFAVLNEDHTLAGYVSKSDLANIGLGDTAAEIELLRHTSVDEIARAIDGAIVYTDEYCHYDGRTSIVALNQYKVANYSVENRIVIVGNDADAQKELIKKGAGMLIVVWSDTIDDSVCELAKKYHCPLIISGHGAMNTSRYLFLAPPVRLIMTKEVVSFKDSEFVEDAGAKMLKTRYRSYPVLDEKKRLIGYVSRFHILHENNKKIILVDHNEFSQSVKNIDKALILEVVDHHRINDFATSQPISFRNEIIGSCATIIATIFKENQIEIPSNLAGLLLGAILSDTLIFQSPTTTKKDIEVAHQLSKTAGLDIDVFAKEMFSKSASSEKQTIYEMLIQDIKYFDLNGTKTMISQIIVPSIESISKRESEIYHDMEILNDQKELDLLVVCFTSVIENGSVFYIVGDGANKVSDVFQNGVIQKGIVSRKKQMVPMLMEALG
ncbi:MAG: putative manganese-dependent inorganic diphosphatase [Faecalicoccus sp.]|nr:putative manganese-dependent inorganic diphosphatase [Faecalicoccus sp.]